MNTSEATTLIKELMEKTLVPVSDILVTEGDNGKTTWFAVEVKEPHLFLSRGAEGLFAVNHLVRKIIENKNPKKAAENDRPRDVRDSEPEFLVDINGFHKKKIENLHAVAYMMAERARYFKSNVEIDPMPAFERRVIHEFLSSATDVKTESEGAGQNRRVVIKYIGGL